MGSYPLLNNPAPWEKINKNQRAGNGNPENPGEKVRTTGILLLNLKTDHQSI